MSTCPSQEVLALIGQQKAEFSHAARLRTWLMRIQIVIGLLAISTIAINIDTFLYFAAVLAIILAAGWLFVWNELSESRTHAERLRRATMLAGGLGFTLGGSELLELTRGGKASPAEAKRLIDPNYFASARHPGSGRLVDMLEESAIWTANLAKIAAHEARMLFGGLIFALIIALLVAAPLAASSNWQLGARIVFAIVAILLSSDFLGSAIRYNDAANVTRRVVDRLQAYKVAAPPLEPIMLIFGDYNAAVEAMPPFSSGLYPRHEKRLNEEYRMFLTGPQ